MSDENDDAEKLQILLADASTLSDFPFHQSPFGPWTTGLLLFVVAAMFGWIVTSILEGQALMTSSALTIADLSITAVMAYTLTMNEVGRRGFLRDYAALLPSLVISDSEKLVILAPVLQQRTMSRIISGSVFMFITLPLVVFFVFVEREAVDEIYSVSLVLLALMLFVVGGAMFDTFFSYRRLLGLMKPGLKIDLLDLRPLEVIGHTGVRIALMMAIGAVLATPLLVEENALLITSIFLIALLGGAFLVMLLPSLEASRAIRGAKERELRRVNDMIRSVREDMKRDTVHSEKMQGLIAYRTMVVDISVWPVSMPTLFRVVAITSLPVISVFGGVALEQVVERFMS